MNTRPWLAVLLVLAAPLAAQQPGKPPADSMRHPMMPMAPMMGAPMMQQMGPAMMHLMLYTPQHLLAREDALGLNADQVKRLTALRDGTRAAHEAAQAEAETHLKEMEQGATAATPDTSALKVHFQAAHAAMGKAHWVVLVSAVQARAVLSGTQRAKVQVWAYSMDAWTQQHRKMMHPTRSN